MSHTFTQPYICIAEYQKPWSSLWLIIIRRGLHNDIIERIMQKEIYVIQQLIPKGIKVANKDKIVLRVVQKSRISTSE